jgi:hypothetical protein
MGQVDDNTQPQVTFTVSCRGKGLEDPMSSWLEQYSIYSKYGNITSVFGFLDPTPLYGGREFTSPEISEEDIEYLYKNNITISIPLTNHRGSLEEYIGTKPLLQKLHKKGNKVICVNDTIAKWVRQDFPLYSLEASVIKNTHPSGVKKVLEGYDTVVLPAKYSTEYKELSTLSDKGRITLFGVAGCAYNCPSKICYPSISVMNKGVGEFKCSKDIKNRDTIDIIYFNLNRLALLGYRNFKLVTVNTNRGY